jgi:hypothetical protein
MVHENRCREPASRVESAGLRHKSRE